MSIVTALKNLNLGPDMGRVLQRVFESRDQRKAFIAVLLATSASVAQKPNFNIELELNDLWTRLSLLRAESSGSPMAGVAQAMQRVSTAAQSILKGLAAPGARVP
jgi:hypothetical protein